MIGGNLGRCRYFGCNFLLEAQKETLKGTANWHTLYKNCPFKIWSSLIV